MWLADNIVAVSAIFLGLCVLVGLIALAVTGTRMYRQFRRTNARVAEPMERLTASLETTERLQAEIPLRQEALDVSLAELQVQARAIGILASHASEAMTILRSPLKYVGR
jgi:hypothetical protein